MEQIRDLLDLENSMTQLNKASSYEPTMITVTAASEVYYLIDKASNNRVVSDNSFNERSSLSHSIFQLLVTSKHTQKNISLEGAINLIDLAGSERLHKSGSKSKQILIESRSINKSLSCLKDVIKSLANNDSHIPYRNSKLTYVLQPHLSSKSSKVLMMVNASPLTCHIPETVNSLRFASEVNS